MHDDPRPGSIPAAAEERAAFEAWAESVGRPARTWGHFSRSPDDYPAHMFDRYITKEDCDRWDAWQARAALAAPKAEAWQPIETAPKDGTEVLLWREDCGQFIGRYCSASAFPLTQSEIDAMDEETLFAEDWFTQWPDARRMDGTETPTHWMPLPPAPTSPAPQEPK